MRGGMADEVGKLVLRLTLGVLILLHGIAKITGGVESIEQMVEGAGLPGFVAYGAYLGEVLGPVLLLIGWYARVGAGLIALNMLFAFALVHSGELLDRTDSGGWALELQGMYLFTAITLILTGPGRLSVNQR